MAEIEQMLREILGEGWSKLNQFQTDQVKKITSRVQDIAREAVKEDIARLTQEVAELRARLTTIEAERIEASAEQV